MTRDEMFQIARDCGWERGKWDKTVEDKIRKRLLEAITPDALAAAPAVWHGDQHRKMTMDDAIDALVEEIRGA